MKRALRKERTVQPAETSSHLENIINQANINNNTAGNSNSKGIRLSKTPKRKEVQPQTGITISGEGLTVGKNNKEESHSTTTVATVKAPSTDIRRKTRIVLPPTKAVNVEETKQEQTVPVNQSRVHNTRDKANRTLNYIRG